LDGDRLQLSGGDASHLIRVLRLGPGACFVALDGQGLEYQARIVTIGKNAVEAAIEGRRQRRTEPRLRLTLGQAIPKGDKMEQAIVKGTELGLAGFWPLSTERCVAILPAGRVADRLQRWRRVATQAARQSGRAVVPIVDPPRTWAEAALEFSRFDLVLLAWEGEMDTSLKEILTARERPTEVLALVGPEGGLTQAEVALAQANGAVALSLGPRILRTETAGLVIGSALFYHYDELAWVDVNGWA